jgi:hypothetical protein
MIIGINMKELTDEERWQQNALENNICMICSYSREVCGGEKAHG